MPTAAGGDRHRAFGGGPGRECGGQYQGGAGVQGVQGTVRFSYRWPRSCAAVPWPRRLKSPATTWPSWRPSSTKPTARVEVKILLGPPATQGPLRPAHALPTPATHYPFKPCRYQQPPLMPLPNGWGQRLFRVCQPAPERPAAPAMLELSQEPAARPPDRPVRAGLEPVVATSPDQSARGAGWPLGYEYGQQPDLLGTTCTCVTSTEPRLYHGQRVEIRGAAETDYNGIFTITVTGHGHVYLHGAGHAERQPGHRHDLRRHRPGDLSNTTTSCAPRASLPPTTPTAPNT